MSWQTLPPPSPPDEAGSATLDALLGLGAQSVRKSYFPELQKTIDELAAEREKFRTIFNNSVQLIGLLDTDGILLEANTRALDFVGVGPGEVIGRPFEETPWWSGNPTAVEQLRAGMAAARAGRVARFETHHPYRDAGTRNLEVTITPLFDAAGTVILLIPEARDITDRKALEAERLNALGTLVSGIAHEINTPLGVSLTGISFLKKRVQDLATLPGCPDEDTLVRSLMEELGQAAELVERNIERTAQLVRSFRSVAADQAPGAIQRFNLARHLSEILLSLERPLKEGGHRFELDCPGTIELESHPDVITQVIAGMVANSLVHGFGERRGGTIRLSARPEGPRVVLRLYDNGKGIAPEHRDRIFEPFFTTRRGTGSIGLGLHVAYNLVTHVLRGSLTLAPGGEPGTCFELSLPREIDVV